MQDYENFLKKKLKIYTYRYIWLSTIYMYI